MRADPAKICQRVVGEMVLSFLDLLSKPSFHLQPSQYPNQTIYYDIHTNCELHLGLPAGSGTEWARCIESARSRQGPARPEKLVSQHRGHAQAWRCSQWVVVVVWSISPLRSTILEVHICPPANHKSREIIAYVRHAREFCIDTQLLCELLSQP